MSPRKLRNGEQMVSKWLVAVMAVALVTPLSACGHDDRQPKPKPAALTETPSGPVPPAMLTLTPDGGSKNVPISAEIGLHVSGGAVTDVTLKDDEGKAVAGTLRDDGTAWVPREPLKTTHQYEATATAENAAGQRTTATTRFSTMGTPARRTGTGLYLFDDHTYGVAMPVVAEFIPGIQKADRAAVQKRMFVTTDPPQPGTWSWTSSGTQAYYRAPTYWKPGTTLTVRLAVGGLPTGGGRYGSRDRSATAKIGRSFVMSVENKTKKMTVVENGRTLRTMPVSLGKRSTPSSSGAMVIMDKRTSTIFDTTDTDGEEGYRITIAYAQRLTWSGQYIHSAPWSVGAQGHRNVSHGCVNLSPSNARWLFGKTLIGDPITVRGTSDKLVYGNGWTPWNVSWTEFKKGSALPVPEGLS